jgi:hypothetical protein
VNHGLTIRLSAGNREAFFRGPATFFANNPKVEADENSESQRKSYMGNTVRENDRILDDRSREGKTWPGRASDGEDRRSRNASDCAAQARTLLDAWDHNDGVRLTAELSRTALFCTAPVATTVEAERRELLAGIAQELRSGPAGEAVGSGDGSVPACLELLRHLARHSVSPTPPLAARGPRTRRRCHPQLVRAASALPGASRHSSI